MLGSDVPLRVLFAFHAYVTESETCLLTAERCMSESLYCIVVIPISRGSILHFDLALLPIVNT